MRRRHSVNMNVGAQIPAVVSLQVPAWVELQLRSHGHLGDGSTKTQLRLLIFRALSFFHFMYFQIPFLCLVLFFLPWVSKWNVVIRLSLGKFNFGTVGQLNWTLHCSKAKKIQVEAAEGSRRFSLTHSPSFHHCLCFQKKPSHAPAGQVSSQNSGFSFEKAQIRSQDWKHRKCC